MADPIVIQFGPGLRRRVSSSGKEKFTVDVIGEPLVFQLEDKTIEQAVASVAAAGGAAGGAPAALEQQAADLSRQLDDLARIRSELDRMPMSEMPTRDAGSGEPQTGTA